MIQHACFVIRSVRRRQQFSRYCIWAGTFACSLGEHSMKILTWILFEMIANELRVWAVMLNLTIEVVVMRSPRVGRVLGVFSEKWKKEKASLPIPSEYLSYKTKRWLSIKTLCRRSARLVAALGFSPVLLEISFTSTARARAKKRKPRKSTKIIKKCLKKDVTTEY
jgi:hypothetical protein